MRSRTALDQPTRLRPPVSEPVRFEMPQLITALTEHGSIPRGLPDSFSHVVRQSLASQPLHDLPDLVVGEVRIAGDEFRSQDTHFRVENAERNRPSERLERGKHGRVPVWQRR